MLGVIARGGGPSSLLDLDVDLFVALLEGIAREDPRLAEAVDLLYEQAHDEAERLAAASRPQSRAERNNDIRRVIGLFNG